MPHISTFIILIQNYLYLRQWTIVNKINSFDKQFNQYHNVIVGKRMKRFLLKSRFISIQNLYNEYFKETELYSKQLTGFLTILLAYLIAICSYLIHFILYTQVGIFFRLLNIISTVTQTWTLIILIFNCSQVSSFHQKYSQWYQNRLHHCSTFQLTIFTIKDYFKVNFLN